MRTWIIAGGDVNDDFVSRMLSKRTDDFIIAADRGLNCLNRIGIVPDEILGDYDSVSDELVEAYKKTGVPVLRYKAEKNVTDTEAAMNFALDSGTDEIVILGACGGRLDHFMSVVQGLYYALERGVPSSIADPENRIMLIDGPFTLQKKNTFGKYVSLLPFTSEVRDITLTGFKYPLDDYLLKKGCSIGVSNEIVSDEARISFTEGILILILSDDKEKTDL